MKRLGFGLIVTLGLVIFLAREMSPVSVAHSDREAPSVLENTHEPEAVINDSLGNDPSRSEKSELQALSEMTKLLTSFARRGQSMNNLISHLKDRGQNPTLHPRANSDTGTLTIVRTEQPPKGTRYFHAQYFSQESGEGEFAQHLSFEYRPSPESFAQAEQTVSAELGGRKPEIERADFKQWDLGYGYVIWIKRLGSEELALNPFNSYTKEDEGTIRIAVELAPED